MPLTNLHVPYLELNCPKSYINRDVENQWEVGETWLLCDRIFLESVKTVNLPVCTVSP